MYKTAFSIVELLVVIAILALLASLSAPTAAGIGNHARLTLCASNLNNITQALLIYDSQAGSFPNAFNSCPDRTAWWFDSLEFTDQKKSSPLWCPARCVNSPGILFGNFGVNESICTGKRTSNSKRPFTASSIRRPSSKLLIADSGFAFASWIQTVSGRSTANRFTADEFAYIPGLSINSRKKLRPQIREDALFGRHPKKFLNIGFVDGHVERTDPNDLLNPDPAACTNPIWQP